MNTSITVILVIITVILSFYAWNKPEIFNKWLFNPYRVKNNNEYYRMLTSGFIHGDYMHLAFNMISLYYMGTALEQVFNVLFGATGPLYYITLYLVAIVVSDLPSFFKHQRNRSYNSLGASGAVSAVIFAGILFFPTQNIYIFFALPIPAFIFGVLYLVYSYYQGRNTRQIVNHDAHFYGAVFGLVFTIIIFPQVVSHFINEITHWRF